MIPWRSWREPLPTDAGAPVDPVLRGRVASQLGGALDDVRIHDDARANASAADLGARAFTYGRDIFLGPGERASDAALVAHELTHVVRQRGGPPTVQRQTTQGGQTAPAEVEADAVARVAQLDRPYARAAFGLIVDDGVAPSENQLTRARFLRELRMAVNATARASLGAQAADCPYIEQWFTKHDGDDAPTLERLAQRFSGLAAPTRATDYVAPICARVSAGIDRWRGGGSIDDEIAAAGLASGPSETMPGANTAPGANATPGASATPTANAPGANATPTTSAAPPPSATTAEPNTGAATKAPANPAPAVQAKPAAGGHFAEPRSPARVAAQLGPGAPLDGGAAARIGGALGESFSDVRVHTDAGAAGLASELGATAFTVGNHVAFAAGQYRPGTLSGEALLAHELAHVSQQRGATVDEAAQQHSSVERGAEEDDADAAAVGVMTRLYRAGSAAISAFGARARPALRSGLSIRRCDCPKLKFSDPFLQSLEKKLEAGDKAGFFADIRALDGSKKGDADMRNAFDLMQGAGELTWPEVFRAVALQEYGAEAKWPLNVANFADGLDSGTFTISAMPPASPELSEFTIVKAGEAAEGTWNPIRNYKNRFNGKWMLPTYAGDGVDFDPSLDSKGPRNPRARHIFNDLYAGDATIKTAYDGDTPVGFRDACDTYALPEATNIAASPRVQELRALFDGPSITATTTTDAAYTAFAGTVRAKAALLDANDKAFTRRSHDWRLVVERKLLLSAQAVIDDMMSIVLDTPSTAAPPVAAPVTFPAVTPTAAVAAFLAGISITPPASPHNAEHGSEPLDFDIKSTTGNPLSTPLHRRVTLEPAGQVRGRADDIAEWAPGATKAPFTGRVDPANAATGGSTIFTAHLTMPEFTSFAEKPAPVTVVDKRRDWFSAHIDAGATSTAGDVTAGATMRYFGRQFDLNVAPNLPDSNPGLGIFMEGELKRGGVTIASFPSTSFGFDSSQQLGSTIVQQTGPGTDAMVLTIRFAETAGGAPFKTLTLPFSLAAGPAANPTRDAHLLHDDAIWLRRPASVSTSLLHFMSVSTNPMFRNVAAAVAAGRITPKPLMVVSDSRQKLLGPPVLGDPATQVAYAFGSRAHIQADVPEAIGFRVPEPWAANTVFLNVTPDPNAPGTKRPLAELASTFAHESQHLLDPDSALIDDWSSYKTEFRAYWMDGGFDSSPTSTDFSISFGPKSPRANAIFLHLYESSTYPFVKIAYDANRFQFREKVDNLLYPDAINLTASTALEDLRAEVASYTGASFPAKRAAINAKFTALNAADKQQIRSNREWRDLVESKFTVAAERTDIKTLLGIPQ